MIGIYDTREWAASVKHSEIAAPGVSGPFGTFFGVVLTPDPAVYGGLIAVVLGGEVPGSCWPGVSLGGGLLGMTGGTPGEPPASIKRAIRAPNCVPCLSHYRLIASESNASPCVRDTVRTNPECSHAL